MDPLKSTCRACFQVFSSLKSQKTVNLSNPIQSYYNKPSVTYHDAFVACTGFNLKEMEPQELCEDCASELVISFQFKEKCQTTQNKLEKLLQETEALKLEEVVIKVEPLEEFVAEEVDTIEVFPENDDTEVMPENDDNSESSTRLKCEFCGKSFSNKPNLKYHLNHAHKDEDDAKVWCPHCDTSHFAQLFTTHIRMCKKRYKRWIHGYKSVKVRDVTDTESNARLKCEFCQKSFSNKPNLKYHLNHTHKDEDDAKVWCPHCETPHFTQLFTTHIRMCKKRYKSWKRCPKSDVTDTEVLPENDDDPESDLRIKCDFCRKSFSNQPNLKYHLNHAHKDDAKVQCPHCETPQFAQLLNTHIRMCKKRDKSRQNSNPRSICPVCGELKRSDHIKKHLETRNEKKQKQKQNTEQKNYICDICGHSVVTKLGLMTHIKTIHLKIKVSCKRCTLKFRTYQQLDTHTRKIHPEVRPLFKCQLCDYQTPFHVEIKKHHRRHTGERNYKCNICRKEFFSKDKLNMHVALHSDERPFACDTCGASFKTRRYLTIHMRIHQGRNYECPVCQRGFLTNQLLTQHAKSQHPDYQMPPPGTVMSKSFRKKMAEKMLKLEAMKRGADQKTLDAIVVTEAPPIEEFQLFQNNQCVNRLNKK